MLNDIICGGQNLFYWIMERLFDLFDMLVGTFLSFLPRTPFEFEQLSWGDFGKLVGYVFPLQAMTASFILLLTAIGLYYGIRYILRMLKLVQ